MAALNALMIVGTDTEVGKTVLTSALAAYWQKFLSPRSLGLMKPVQSGVGDRELYQRLFLPDHPLEAITPQYFEAPLAPPLAAATRPLASPVVRCDDRPRARIGTGGRSGHRGAPGRLRRP